MSLLRTARKLVLGETWALPVGIALAVGAGALLREASGGAHWWRVAGGAVLVVLLLAALALSLRSSSR
ncbi:MAG: hypothetical protein M3Z33_09155 [Actinomycetota bacterium]|nr:hypothetical protein [Actinomycetota bacterium]